MAQDLSKPLLKLIMITYTVFFLLEWLNDGNLHRSREARASRGKSSLKEDVIHVIMAIMEGLDDQLVWSDKNHRRELSNVFPGFFCGSPG
jgi:hypothetical protein